MKIILVDDELKFISMLGKRLTLRGFDVDIATSGEKALEMEAQSFHDVAVLDIKMPGISGVKLRKKLSAINPALIFIFVTGHGTLENCENELETGDICLPKPLNIETLIKTMKDVAGEGRSKGT